MLRTLTRELRPGISVTVQEATNQSYYEGRLLYKRFVLESDDTDCQTMKLNFIFIGTRTLSTDGVETISVNSVSSNEELDRAFAAFMAMPSKLTDAWAALASQVGEEADQKN